MVLTEEYEMEEEAALQKTFKGGYNLVHLMIDMLLRDFSLSKGTNMERAEDVSLIESRYLLDIFSHVVSYLEMH